MSDLIERLRHWAEHYHNADLDEAADEIERLRAANESVAVCVKHVSDVTRGDCLVCEIERLQAVVDAARHLLAGGDKEAVYHLEKAIAALEGEK